MIELSKYNFSHLVEHTYDDITNCDEYGCHEEGICRCSKIINQKIQSINITAICDELYRKYFDNSITTKRNNKIDSLLGDITTDVNKYTLDRILRINKLFDTTKFTIDVINGYYGEEIGDILIKEDIANKIENQLSVAFNIFNLNERVIYLLHLEYGYLLPELKSAKFSIQTIRKDELVFGSKSQSNKVSEKKLNYYQNYGLMKGVVLKTDSGFRLIDGYHRCSVSDSESLKVIVAEL